MAFLDAVILRDAYDVVVVGSGLAGLTAAALLRDLKAEPNT